MALTGLDAAALAAGVLVTGQYAFVVYDSAGPRWRAMLAQPLDGTLSALAAMAWSSGTQYVSLTAADTITLQTLGTAALKNTGTSGNNVPLLDGANTWSAAQTITLTTPNAALTVQSTDAGAGNGPNLILDRFSASPAASDVLSYVPFRGRDSAGNTTDYGWVSSTILDPVDGSEDGRLTIGVFLAGASTSVLTLDSLATFGVTQIVPLGSVSAPSVAPTGGATTGVYFPTTAQVGITIAGTQRFTFSGSALASGTLPFQPAGGSVGTPGQGFQSETDCGHYVIGTNNIGLALNGALAIDYSTTRMQMGTGVDLVLADTGPSNVLSAGFRGAPLMGGAAVNAARTFGATDMGKTAYHDEVTARTWTIDSNANYAAPIGSVMILDNTGNAGAAGAITLNITSDTLRRGDGVSGTGSRTIGANQVAVVRKVAATVWTITGGFT